MVFCQEASVAAADRAADAGDARALLCPHAQTTPTKSNKQNRDLRAALIRGDLDAPECAYLAAPLVCPSLLPLHLAAHRAATLCSRGRLKARTVHAELVHGMSGSKHVESGR
jgi:hypothetical protein